MKYGTLLWAFFLSVFSTCVISYVAIATAIGPWIGPTLALLSLVFFAPFCSSKKEMILATAAGSIGGIVGTAVTFSFPTWYFLAPDHFLALVQQPFLFLGLLMSLVFVSGYFGMSCAYYARHGLLEEQRLAFPVGQLVYKIINAQTQKNKTKELLYGVVIGFGYAVLQMKQLFGHYVLPRVVKVWSDTQLWKVTLPALRLNLDLLPMFLSIGFIAGHMITLPLLVGAVAKMFIADPIHMLCFSQLESTDFIFAFCAGIVLSGAVSGVLRLPQQLYQGITQWLHSRKAEISTQGITTFFDPQKVVLGFLLFGFLSWYNFSLAAQLYLIITAGLCVYQIAHIAGKIGLALLGRFATFVLVPGLLIFGYDPLQITLVSTFVEVAGGVAAEVLFGLKTAQLGQVDERELYWYQLFGVVSASIAVALVFYFLVTRFELGSAQLFAQRAQARALLVHVASFNYYVLALGVAFGIIVKELKMSPMLVLGGLLMPLSLSLSLIAGGGLSYMVKDKREYEPLCSGLYAANALAMFIKILL